MDNITNKFFITRPLLVTVLVNFIGAFQFGYNIGVPSNTADVCERIQKERCGFKHLIVGEFMNRTLYEREGSVPSKTRVTDLWAITVAIFYIGAGVGALGFRWFSQHVGRKGGLLCNIFVGFVASALMFSSRRSERWELLLVGRAVIGMHVGLGSSLVSTYLSEVSPKSIRGAIGSLSPIGLTSSVLVAQIMGFPDLLGTDDLWDVLFGFAAVPCLLQLILLPLCVESPRYLMVTLKDKAAARRAFKVLRQSEDVGSELQDLQEEMSKTTKLVSLVDLFKYPPYRRAATVGILSAMTLNLTGFTAVLFFSNQLFQEIMDLSQSEAAYLTSSIGVIQILMALIATPLTDKVGRRILQLAGLTGLVICTLMITVFLALRHQVPGFDVASIVFLLLFLVFFGIGPGHVPWILTAELFTQNARPVASSLAMSGLWLCGFAVTYVFPPMRRGLKDFVFLPFCGYLLLVTVYTYFNLPETKGKTIQEISALFEKPGDSLKKTEAYNMSDQKSDENVVDEYRVL